MIDSTENRATRRSKARRAKTVAVAGAAVAAMTVGLAAPSNAATTIDVTWDPAYTTGALAGVLNAVGQAIPGLSVAGGLYNSGPPQNVFISQTLNAGIFGDITLNLTLLLKYLSDSSVKGLYNTLGGIPQPTCAGSYASNCRYALELATSEGTQNLVEAYRTQIQSVTTRKTPNGFIPFEAAPNSTAAKPTQTNQVLGFVQNPYRPNGGFYSRFPQWSEFFGVDPTMPAAGKYKSQDQKIALNTTTLDVTWAYDPTADLPEVPNLLAFANSLSAALPINLLTGSSTDIVLADSAGNATTTTAVGLNVATLLQISLASLLGAPPDGQAYYATLVGDQLPLLAPSRLPTLAINALLKAVKSPYLLGNPFLDAIEPALKILVNIAYPDVVAPDKGGTYNRTFLTGGTDIPFNSVDPLTPEERAQVPGDVWDALKAGIAAQAAKPFWGILVPNTGTQSAATTPAPVKAASAVKAAAATTAPATDPGAVAPVSVPAPQVSAPQAPAAPVAAPADPAPAVEVSAPAVAPAPIADPAPVIDLPAPAADPAPVAPKASVHRGPSTGSDNSDNSDNSSGASSKGHRGAA